MKKFADTIVRESVASAMQHNKLPDELSVVDVHKAILKLPRCDFLRNSYLGYKKEDTMGSYPTAATAATSDSKEIKAESSYTDISGATPTVNVKTEPMETMESRMVTMDTELSNQGMSSTMGSVASSLNLKMEVMDESSNETRSLTRSSGDRIQMERRKSLSRTSSLASMTDFETLIPEFEIPPLMQDDWEVLFSWFSVLLKSLSCCVILCLKLFLLTWNLNL